MLEAKQILIHRTSYLIPMIINQINCLHSLGISSYNVNNALNTQSVLLEPCLLISYPVISMNKTKEPKKRILSQFENTGIIRVESVHTCVDPVNFTEGSWQRFF